MDKSDESGRSRRAMLKSLAAAAATATGVLIADQASAGFSLPFRPKPKPEPPKILKKLLIFRLQTRNTKACNACQIHHRYIVFRTRMAADENRAHEGCDCPIVLQEVDKLKFKRLFPRMSDTVAYLKRGDSK